jgi:hypothetical protein
MMTLIARPPASRRKRAAAVPPVLCLGMALAIALLGPVPPAQADLNINFETAPFPTTAQPSDYATAGAMQTYTQPGVFSITGGVVLGNPTFLPQFPGNGSPPNLYGTTDVADPSLLSTITLRLDPSLKITAVSGLLFNGQNFVASGNTESYTITAFSGGTQVAAQNPVLSTDLTSPGSFTNFSLSSTLANVITSVTFTTPNAGTNGWDFLVDSIHATTSVHVIPEPSTMVIASATLVILSLTWGWRRRWQATA